MNNYFISELIYLLKSINIQIFKNNMRLINHRNIIISQVNSKNIGMNSNPIHAKNLGELLNVYNYECNKIRDQYQVLGEENIVELFKSTKFLMEEQLRNPRKLIQCQLAEGHNQDKEKDRSFSNQQIQYTSRKYSKNIENSSNLDKNRQPLKKPSSKEQQHKKVPVKSLLQRKMNRKLSQLKISYQQLEASWDKNLEQNENIFYNELQMVHNAYTKCDEKLKELSKDGNEIDFNEESFKSENQNINLMKTSRKQRNSQQMRPQSQSIHFTKFTPRLAPIMNAPKKERKFRKIRKLSQQEDQQTNPQSNKEQVKIQSATDTTGFHKKNIVESYRLV